MENLSSITIKPLTSEELQTWGAKAHSELTRIIQGAKKDTAEMPDLPKSISLADDAGATTYNGNITLAFAFGVVYAIAKTELPIYMDIGGAKLTFEANGVAFGAGFGGAALTGHSIYTAEEIAAFGNVHVHLDVASLYTQLNMWTTNMMPIGVWFGPNAGPPIGGGTFGANCAIATKS